MSWLALMALASAPVWAQQTDTVGGTSGNNVGSASFKLSVYEVGTAVMLESFAPYVEPQGNGVEAWHVVYQANVGGTWDLIWDSGSQPISAGLDYKSSGNVGIVLDPAQAYAIGLFLAGGNDVSYFWGDVGGEDLGWAWVERAVFATNGSVGGSSPPDPLFGQDSFSPYHQQITVSFGEDLDGDGAGSLVDCDDNDATVFPGADELCDGIDNDCDTEVDENVVFRDVYPDADGDGFGNGQGTPMSVCEPDTPGYADNAEDCDDTNADVNPAAPEICDGVDNDCDGVMLPDETIDEDGDGAPVCFDCDDTDPETWPGRPDDPCNGVDNDCDGTVPEGDACNPFADEGLKIAASCGCDAGGTLNPLWMVAALVALARRRRAVSRQPSAVS